MKPTDPRNPLGYRFLMAHVDHQGDDCLIYPYACCTPGYGISSYQKKRHLAHRFICEQKNGPPPEGHLAAHSCGNRRCVNPKHLSWKTHAGNQLDRREHGTNSKRQAKLTLRQAMQIRALKGLESAPETAAKYSITESNVRLIQEGKTWRDDRKIPMALTTEQVLAIRRIGYSKSLREISIMLGVGTGAIDRVRNGRTHKSVV